MDLGITIGSQAGAQIDVYIDSYVERFKLPAFLNSSERYIGFVFTALMFLTLPKDFYHSTCYMSKNAALEIGESVEPIVWC